MNRISIITVNLNNARGLSLTMDSVFKQSFSDYEYIVIDGGSSDGSKELIEKQADAIHYWVSEPDKGIYQAMNKGIRKASGEYVLFLNSGDYLADAEVLAGVNAVLGKADIVYGNLYEGTPPQGGVTVFPDILTVRYMMQSYLGHPSTFIRRSLFADNLYSEDLKIASDWEFFFKKIVVDGCSYLHVNRTISIYNLEGVSAAAPALGEQERHLVLSRLLSPILYEEMKAFIRLESSPIVELVPQLERTHKFQYRVKKIVKFLLRVNQLFSKKC